MSAPDRPRSSIFDYDLRAEIRQVVISAFENAKEQLQEEGPTSPAFDVVTLERALVVDEWANSEAIVQDTPLSIVALFSFGGFNYRDEVAQEFAQRMEIVIEEEEIEIPPKLDSLVPSILIEPGNNAIFEDVVSFNLGDRTGNTVVEVIRGTVYTLGDEGTRDELLEFKGVSEGRGVREVPYEPAVESYQEIIREEEEDFGEFALEETLPIEEITPTPIPPEIEEEEPTELERLQEEYPEVPTELLEFINDDGTLDIRAGKETKQVEPREMYGFEKRLAFTMDRLDEEGFDGEEDQLPHGVGRADDMGLLGETKLVPNYPQTVQYIKYRLLYEGPAYQLEVFNDIVVYVGFIRNIWEHDFRASSYQTVRTIFSRLQKVHKEGLTPQLIRPLTAEELQSNGFDITPKMKLRGGGEIEAPWLENRKYYKVVEENVNHPAWDNLHDILYGE